jgi:hypothetical protein
MSLRAVLVWSAAFAADVACAKVQCQYNTECGERARCVETRCVTDCFADRDCPSERPQCTANGECVAAAPADARAPEDVPADATLPDAPALTDIPPPRDLPTADVPVVALPDMPFATMDVPAPQDLPTSRDVPAAPDLPGPDIPSPRDVPVADAGGVAAPGVYEYTAVRPDTLVYPASVAWHPGGAYALILANTDGVYRYDVATRAVSRVANTMPTLAWRQVTFTPDGTRAVLLGNTGSGTARVGRMYHWDPGTNALTERAADALTGGGYESLAWAPGRDRGFLLGSRAGTGSASITVWRVGTDGVRGTPLTSYGLVASTGCEDLDWVPDGFGDPGLAVVCGTNTAMILSIAALDGTPRVTQPVSPGEIGNVSRIAARPQGDIALAVGSSGQRLYRVRQGAWSVGFNAPTVTGAFGVAFSTDGRRALAFGGAGRAWEYRTDLYDRAEILDVSIPNLAGAPFLQPSGAQLRDIAWRPGCDEGLAVGGSSTLAGTSAFVSYFRVTSGSACAN